MEQNCQIHLEDVLLVPENARKLEKDPLIFEDDDEMVIDNTHTPVTQNDAGRQG